MDGKGVILPNQDNYDFFSVEVNNLHWKEFEKIVINIFQKIFDASQIDIIHTQFSHDGGRDGEGVYNVMQCKNEVGFAIQLKIWIEVKKRSAKVTGNDIGFHALKALLDKVSLIVFASNSSFSPQVEETLSLLANFHNINCDLVDGKRLFKFYQKYLLNHTDSINIDNKSMPTIKNNININFSFSRHFLKRYSKKSIEIEVTEPFYVFIDFDFKNSLFDFIGDYEIYIDDIQFVKYDKPPLIHALRFNSKVTHTWVAYSKKIVSSPTIKIHFPNESITNIERQLNINVQKPLFALKPPESVALKTGKLNDFLTAWFESGIYKSVIIYGNAGTGKSYLINHYRYLWLKNNASEIIVDGEIENSESVLLNRFIQDIFFVPIGLLGEEQENRVYDFFVSCQLSSRSAKKLANIICAKKEIDAREFSSDVLSDLLYFLIKKKSEHRKTIIVYEDIHKCQPSVIRLLIKTHKRLICDNIKNVFILLCSRKSTSFKNQGALEEWLYYIEEILEDQNIQSITLEPYSINEASAVIQNAIFSISEIDTYKIIEQVGTTPFGLKEALFYMYQKNWLEYDSKINQFLLKKLSMHGLKSAIKSDVFTKVTKSRISEFKLMIPRWASIFIDASACYGTSFNKNWCFDILDTVICDTEINNFLALSSKLGILKNSNLHSDHLKFDHDLIRVSLVHDMGEIGLRELSSKLLKIIPDDPSNYKQKAFLSFQAGIPEATEFYSEHYGDSSVEKEIYEDALEAYKMTLCVVDRNFMTGTRITNTSLWFIDDALNIAKTNQVELFLSITNRNEKIISLCKKIIDVASHIGSGSQEIVKAFTTEGLMLAKVLCDHQSLGIFHIRQGICLFDQKDLYRSIDEFHKALKYLPSSDHYNRGHAFIELAISLRHTGKKHESFKALKQALREAGDSNPEIRLRVFANAGSLHFNTDWKFTRKYWYKALKIAIMCGSTHYWVHMLIDIAHLDLLDNRFNEAEENYLQASKKAQASGLKSQEFKINLHRSILALTPNEEYETLLFCAEALLKQAELLGITYSIDRRLWKVYANWANVVELKAKMLSNKPQEKKQQLWHLAYTYDKKVINEFENLIFTQNNAELMKDRKIISLLINIYLRSLNSNYPNQEIFEIMDNDVLQYIKFIGNLILKNEIKNIPQNLMKFLKSLLGNYRFVFT